MCYFRVKTHLLMVFLDAYVDRVPGAYGPIDASADEIDPVLNFACPDAQHVDYFARRAADSEMLAGLHQQGKDLRFQWNDLSRRAVAMAAPCAMSLILGRAAVL
jgi:hypothetical protein